MKNTLYIAFIYSLVKDGILTKEQIQDLLTKKILPLKYVDIIAWTNSDLYEFSKNVVENLSNDKNKN